MLNCANPQTLPYFKKLFSSLERMDGLLQRHLPRIYRRNSRDKFSDSKHRMERVALDGNILSYAPDDVEQEGLYVSGDPLTPDKNYFEIEILDSGVTCGMTLGLVASSHQLDIPPGWGPDSVGLHLSDGRLYKGSPRGALQVCKGRCETGDKLGCGIKFEQLSPTRGKQLLLPVFFTRNGKELASVVFGWPPSGLHPAVSLHSQGEEVQLNKDMRWRTEEDLAPMCVDSNEDDWLRLHDIRLNGPILEYAGQGKSIVDVGLAQARYPLDTTSHYFEIEIQDPGKNGYIAIGLARRDYPKYRHPGWNKGSIAYHADDGKIFMGSGVGDPFGPKCSKGDIMGCGILFPRDYVCPPLECVEGSREMATPSPFYEDDDDDDEESERNNISGQSDSEDEQWWRFSKEAQLQSKTLVQVFFTRNGKTIGQKEVCIPKGGFYPTVGMLSCHETVRVDLHPLTG